MHITEFDLDVLKEATALVDRHLDELERAAAASPDPDAYGIYDKMEYMTGLGFVACQTYATAVRRWTHREAKRDALALGPKHRTGRTIIQLVNAAANHWKHSPEWSLDAPSNHSLRTLEVLQSLGVDTQGSYPLANTLHQILAPHRPRFANLTPFLVQWRQEMMR